MTTNNIKYWLEEKELKTPEHDEMVLWCFNNTEKIINSFNLKDMEIYEYFHFPSYSKRDVNWDWETKKCILIQDSINLFSKWKLKVLIEEKEKIEKSFLIFSEETKKYNEKRFEIIKEIEYAIPSGNWNIGFIDLRIKINLNLAYTEYFREDIKNSIINWGDKFNNFFLEIKPEIKSLGEVMRQINFYRKYLEKGIFILVTKTKGLKEIFKSQGIYVYEYSNPQRILEKIDNKKDDDSKQT